MTVFTARKKPVLIKAILYTGTNHLDVLRFTGRHPTKFSKWFEDDAAWVDHVKRDRNVIKIFTLEGVMEANPGDYIIRGVKGEHYPCKADIFHATYDVL